MRGRRLALQLRLTTICLLLLAVLDAVLGPRERMLSVWHVLQRILGQPVQGPESSLMQLIGPWGEALVVLSLAALMGAGIGRLLRRRGLISRA